VLPTVTVLPSRNEKTKVHAPKTKADASFQILKARGILVGEINREIEKVNAFETPQGYTVAATNLVMLGDQVWTFYGVW
jgi:hypothetical protein